MQPSGTAHNAAEAERNLSKNRNPFSDMQAPSLELKSFLQRALDFDQQIGGAHERAQLNAQQKVRLVEAEKQVVSLTGWLMLAYPGSAESTNCDDPYYHDWHLELLEAPLDHPPGVGDPTAIICEITPRTEGDLYRRGVRLRNLAAYVRLADNINQPTGHPPHKVRLTGYVMWDDAHDNPGEVGARINWVNSQKLSRPWRRTAWELHPVWHIVDLGSQ